MDLRQPYGVLRSYSIKHIFHDKMDLRLFYFREMVRTRKNLFKGDIEISITSN